MTGWQWHQLDHMQVVCTSLQTDNHASTSSLKILRAGCTSCCPTNSIKALKEFQSTEETVRVQKPIQIYIKATNLHKAILIQLPDNVCLVATLYSAVSSTLLKKQLYLGWLERRSTPVIFNHLLSLVDVFPSSFHGSIWWSGTDAAVGSTTCDTTTPHNWISQTFFATLLAPQQVVFSENMPVVTSLWCPRQVSRIQVWQNIQCHLSQQHTTEHTSSSVINLSIIHKQGINKFYLHFIHHFSGESG